MSNIKVTIALSVYNVEKYLPSCLDCIINQTYRNIEILCIDDCSTDNTWNILNEYATSDSRIRLLRQPKNMGLSCSRNLAMSEASGEYILMVDGDDLFDLQMVELAIEKTKNGNIEMVVWDYVSFVKENEIPTKLQIPSVLVHLNISYKKELLRHPGFTWIHLFKLSMLKRLNIHFPEGLTKQDIPVYWEICTQLPNEKIAILPLRLSYYRQSPTSTTSRKDKSLLSLVYVMDLVESYIIKNHIYEEYKDEYWRLRLTTLHGLYDNINKAHRLEVLRIIKSKILPDAIGYYNSNTCLLNKRTIWFYKMLEGKLQYKLLYKSFIMIRCIYRTLKIINSK